MTHVTPTELHTYVSRPFNIVVEESKRLSEYTIIVVDNRTKKELEEIDCSEDELYEVRDKLIFKYLIFNFNLNL